MDRFVRNLGLLTPEQQEALKNAHVTVCGVGGMGGIAAEALVRMGLGAITIIDNDTYELSNMNRQMHCTEGALGRPKVQVIAEKLRAINPALKLISYEGLTEVNVKWITRTPDLIINGMDDIRASILLEREARKQKKTIVDAWITPFASVFVMGPESPHWEKFLKFPTQNKKIEEITEDDIAECLRLEVAFTLNQFDSSQIVKPELIDKVIRGELARPSLVPVVWLSGTLMANEAMKILTHQGKIATHWGVFYNHYEHEIRVLNEGGTLEEKPRYLKAAV